MKLEINNPNYEAGFDKISHIEISLDGSELWDGFSKGLNLTKHERLESVELDTELRKLSFKIKSK